jgi:hypothetical protein
MLILTQFIIQALFFAVQVYVNKSKPPTKEENAYESISELTSIVNPRNWKMMILASITLTRNARCAWKQEKTRQPQAVAICFVGIALLNGLRTNLNVHYAARASPLQD